MGKGKTGDERREIPNWRISNLNPIGAVRISGDMEWQPRESVSANCGRAATVPRDF